MINNTDRKLKFGITFFKSDVDLIKKANKILMKVPVSSKMANRDVNYNLIVRSATNFVHKFSRDPEFILVLKNKCCYEMERIRKNSETNAKRRSEGKDLIVSDTVTIEFFQSTINSLFAVMKKELEIPNLTLEVFMHSFTLYYVNRIINSYEGKSNQRFKSYHEIMKNDEKVEIIKEETKDISKFKTFKQALEEANKVVEVKENENPVIVLSSKRDKKKLKKEINNLAHKVAVEDLIGEEKAEVENLLKEKDRLKEEINKLKLEYEDAVLKAREAKEVLERLAYALMDSGVKTEEVSNNISTNKKTYDTIMLKRIISARKMRKMSTSRQQNYLNNL